MTPFTQSGVQWELPDRLIVIQSSIVVNVGYLQMYFVQNEQTMRDAGAIGIVKSNGEVKGIFDGSYINPAELIPVSPLVLYYKVEFPSPSYVIQAIEPHAVMNFDSFFNTNSVKVKFYIQNGKKPASSAGMTLTNTDNPVRYINETEFELDKVNIRWGRFDLGKLFYRNFYTPLRIVFDPETQFLVGQFIYDNDTTKTSEFFLAEDHCVGGRENVLAPYEYKNVGNGTNLLALFLQTLANKFRTVVQK